MGWLSKLIGSGVAEPVEAVGSALDELFTSDDERLSHEEVLLRLRQRPQLAQAAISKVEAQHRTLFVAGARPFILWVCGFGLAFTFLVNPLLQWLTGDPGPELPHEVMYNLVLALVGLGSLRTVEKLKGRTK